MAGIKSLAKDTAIYGLSSIIGRFLNWCLVPLYTNVFLPAEYGVVSYIYAIVAFALIVLTYGMETGFFRFANDKEHDNPMEVYSTGLISLTVSSTVFVVAVAMCLTPLSQIMHSASHPSYVMMMAVAVALDAVTALPFSYLRFRKRPMRFAALRLINIGLNIGLNLFFILLCPWIWKHDPGLIAWFYDPDFGVGYIFLANLITSALNLVLLIPEFRGFPYRFNFSLWKRMLVYSAPLLVLGLAGIMNQTLYTVLFPILYPDKAEAMSQLGIYSANLKIAIVMVMFTQAFRFAYEPFIFAKAKERGTDQLASYSEAMKWFVIFAMVIFLGVMFYLDIIRNFISPKYFSGLKVVPIVMIAELFFGVFFNLSLWYKLTDQTAWGMWFSLMGLVITVVLNVLLVPRMGYMGCAWASFACYGAMMLVSYFMGQLKFPIPYHVGRLMLYFVMAIALWILGTVLSIEAHPWISMLLIRTPLLIIYCAAVLKIEKVSLRSLIPVRR